MSHRHNHLHNCSCQMLISTSTTVTKPCKNRPPIAVISTITPLLLWNRRRVLSLRQVQTTLTLPENVHRKTSYRPTYSKSLVNHTILSGFQPSLRLVWILFLICNSNGWVRFQLTNKAESRIKFFSADVLSVFVILGFGHAHLANKHVRLWQSCSTLPSMCHRPEKNEKQTVQKTPWRRCTWNSTSAAKHLVECITIMACKKKQKQSVQEITLVWKTSSTEIQNDWFQFSVCIWLVDKIEFSGPNIERGKAKLM